MRSLVVLVSAFVVAAVVLAGCSPAPTSSTGSSPETSSVAGVPSTPGPAVGMRLAPGLHELADGSTQAVGVLEYRDLEGGTWIIAEGSEIEGNATKVVAVVANPADFESRLKGLHGHLVVATGTLLQGASIRMAGPEIEIKTIAPVKDVGGGAK